MANTVRGGGRERTRFFEKNQTAWTTSLFIFFLCAKGTPSLCSSRKNTTTIKFWRTPRKFFRFLKFSFVKLINYLSRTNVKKWQLFNVRSRPRSFLTTFVLDIFSFFFLFDTLNSKAVGKGTGISDVFFLRGALSKLRMLWLVCIKLQQSL